MALGDIGKYLSNPFVETVYPNASENIQYTVSDGFLRLKLDKEKSAVFFAVKGNRIR